MPTLPRSLYVRLISKHLGILLAIYLACWLISYALIFLRDGDLDLSYIAEYFYLAWFSEGFEIVGIIKLLSIVLFMLVTPLIYWSFIRKVLKRGIGEIHHP
jgi:hypothetical protein